MKLTYTSVFSYLRVAFTGTLLSAALAMAFVAVNKPGVSSASRPHRLLKKQAEYGLASRSEASDKTGTGEDPTEAAAEDYANRAYPADDVPFSATLDAIAGFNELKGKAIGKDPLGVWSLIGPSTANFPDILTFSGASYTTSGRITALAIDPNCSNATCRVWVGAAGGGVWRTTNALSGAGPSWTFVSGSFGTNAIGSLLLDPNDLTHNTIYAGTGEPNASGDSEAGVGVYKSTDGGNTWALVPDSGKFFQRSIGQMAIDNAGNLLVPIASGVRGVSSVTGGALSSGATGHPLISRGLYRCNGVSSCTQIFVAPPAGCGTRGSTTVRVDPTHTGTGGTSIIYVNAFGGSFFGAGNGGIWRSVDNGLTFQQIFAPVDATAGTCGAALERDEFDVTTLGSGATRMYVGAGEGSTATGGPPATFWRSDDVSSAVIAPFASFGGAQVVNYCTGQCWYDNYVVTPAGHPDMVYLGGSFSYGQLNGKSNARGVLLSQDAGVTWTDQTRDATTDPPPAGSCCNSTAVAGNSIHPDQHALVVNPTNPLQFFEGSDGGLVRSTGTLSDISSQCAARGLTGADLTFCQGLLSAVPSHLFSLNKQLSTLQFQSLSVAADNFKHLQGGTQDNGTFETTGSNVVWPQIIYGDGGQSGFSVTNSAMRFNTFTGQANDVNFQNGDPTKWVVATGAILASVEAAAFYPPIIADPNSAAAGTIFQGSRHVWRTQDWAGSQAFLEANCAEFTTSAANTACGDFQPLGGPSAADCNPAVGPGFGSACLNTGGDLGGLVYGSDRRPTGASRVGSAIARTPSNTNTAWAATGGGRVFISDNIDNATPASVVWNRLDPDLAASADPTRFPSSIYVDSTNAHHAYISYSGYNVNTPTHPGHVFDVSWTGVGTATWTNISYNLPDFPISSVVRDDVTGDLYAGSDFGVMRLPFGTTTWVVTSGLPMVEVAGLTIVPSARVLYAATHGRSAWKVTLP